MGISSVTASVPVLTRPSMTLASKLAPPGISALATIGRTSDLAPLPIFLTWTFRIWFKVRFSRSRR